MYTEILWWQTLLGHFRMTITTLQMLWNMISQLLVKFSHLIAHSHIHFFEIILKKHFHLPLFTLNLFCTSQKPPQASTKTVLLIKGFVSKICRFHHSFLMRYFKMRIKTGWWKPSYICSQHDQQPVWTRCKNRCQHWKSCIYDLDIAIVKTGQRRVDPSAVIFI